MIWLGVLLPPSLFLSHWERVAPNVRKLGDLSLGFVCEKVEEFPMKNSSVANVKLSLASREPFLTRLLTEGTVLSLLERIFLQELLPVVTQTEMFEELRPLFEDLDFVALLALQTLN